MIGPYKAGLVNYNFRVKYIYFYKGMEDKTTLHQKNSSKEHNQVEFKFFLLGQKIIYT